MNTIDHSTNYAWGTKDYKSNYFILWDGKYIYYWSRDTRANVRADLWDDVPVGSLYLSDDRMYQKIANAWADADWYKVTSTNAD